MNELVDPIGNIHFLRPTTFQLPTGTFNQGATPSADCKRGNASGHFIHTIDHKW